jgi:hypothetical protein
MVVLKLILVNSLSFFQRKFQILGQRSWQLGTAHTT